MKNLIEPSVFPNAYRVFDSGFFIGWILKGADSTWYFDGYSQREASAESLKEISEKLFSLNGQANAKI